MVKPTTPMLMPKLAQEGLLEYLKQVNNMQNQNYNLRDSMRRVDLAYMREEDFSEENQRAKQAKKAGDTSKLQNITVPVVLPAVEAAVTYQSSVFLTGHPIFGVVSNPANMDEALQLETLIEDQSVRGGWVNQFILAFRDGFKYNLLALEIDWKRDVTATLETDLEFSRSEAKPKEVIWEGNQVRRIDPYNLKIDTRVLPVESHKKGEFSGYTELMSRVQLKEFINKLPDKMVDNIRAAFESSVTTDNSSSSYGGFYIPSVNPEPLLDYDPYKSTDWMSWAGLANKSSNGIQYKNIFEVTTLYAKIIPADFGLRVPSVNTPQIWKLIYVNNTVLIYAERQTNAHGFLPILIGQPLEDGLGYQTKSLANNVTPIQDVTSTLWNSAIAARRRAISDRGIYDPSRISEAHINNPNPAAKIPVRPAAFGKPVSESYYPIPFRDDQTGVIFQESQQLLQMGNIIAGQNPAKQGQFVKGNKTLHEFSTVMNNANGRDQLVAMVLESQLFTPLKEIIKTNILQYQGGTSIFNRELERVVDIDPIKLRKAVLNFKISDGLTPTDKLINSDTIQVAMQTIASSPALQSQYNVASMFSYFIKTQGGRISEFEKSQEQVAYENALASWQQMIQSAMESLKGMEPTAAQQIIKTLPPQPLPQQFNYNPAQQGTSPATKAPETATKINNITNNISNQVQQ